MLTFVAVSSTRANALDFKACWVEEDFDPWSGQIETVTRCRISGGDIVDYASDTDVPAVLHAQTGADITGQCWYYTSAVTQYVILAQYANGDADIGYDTDPADPGGIVAIGPTLPRCSAEPVAGTDPEADVWAYLTEYIHPPPQPEMSPQTGSGVTGLETFMGIAVPETHTATISSGVTTLDVYIEVSAVVVEWGDGESSSFPPNEELLAGYPDGVAVHTYETKSDAGVPIGVSYDWTARWRVSGGEWEPIPVPDTTTTFAYPLAEIVSRLTD